MNGRAWKRGCIGLLMAAGQAWGADLTVTIGTAATPLKPLMSINAGPTPPNRTTAMDLTAIYQRLGVKMIRTHDFSGPFDMKYMYPDRTQDPTLQSSFNFTAPAGPASISSDDAYQAIVAGGFGVYLRIWDSAGEVNSATSDADRANWAKAAVQVVMHYAKGQWNGFNGDIQYVEIGNEPDSSMFYSGTATQFYQLYVDTAKQIRAEFPNIKIGGPGVTQGGFSNAGGKQWVSNFLDYVKNNSAPLDFFSWYLYSNDAAGFANGAAYFRSTLDTKGFTAAESHVTEWNTEGSNTDITTNSDYRVKAKGAAVTPASYGPLAKNYLALDIQYAAADVGQTRNAYVAALVAGNWYFHNGTNWVIWTGGSAPLPSYFSGTLLATAHVTVFSPLDASLVANGTIYVGYGQSDTEMLSAGRYRTAYTFPAK